MLPLSPETIARRLRVVAGAVLLTVADGCTRRPEIEGKLDLPREPIEAAACELRTRQLIVVHGKRRNRYRITELGRQVADVLSTLESPV